MTYPALDVQPPDPGTGDLLLAIVDDCSPTAAEERGGVLRIFFPDSARRDAARRALAREWPRAAVTSLEVDDEDWARRSQQHLQPVTVGRITVFPGPPPAGCTVPDGIALVIAPSMGFGTGHHATTRLCLAALQTVKLAGAEVLDVGTGSGILALAARLLGAKRASGIDNDADAIRSAVDNLELNPGAAGVTFCLADLRSGDLPKADVLTANLTGALLEQMAPALASAVRPGGTLIVGGLLASERASVAAAFSAAGLAPPEGPDETQEDGWLCLIFGSRV